MILINKINNMRAWKLEAELGKLWTSYDELTESEKCDFVPGENEACHWELSIRGSLLKLFLGTKAITATKQVNNDMGYTQKCCCS